jgi:hypothetical protein
MQCDLILATTNIQNEEKEVNRTVSPARLQPAKRDQVAVGRSNRFGFRQNVVRPTSSSIQPRISEYSDSENNNITQAVPAARSKSATTTSQRTINIAQPAKLDQVRSPTDVDQQNDLNANIK